MSDKSKVGPEPLRCKQCGGAHEEVALLRAVAEAARDFVPAVSEHAVGMSANDWPDGCANRGCALRRALAALDAFDGRKPCASGEKSR